MEGVKFLMCFTYFIVIWTVTDTNAHPISWVTTSNPRPKRSVAEIDVSFYPGLTMELKDSLETGDTDRFLNEESANEGKEEIIIRLLQDERQSSTEEPVDIATQKSVSLTFNTAQTRFQDSVEHIDLPSEEFDLDSVWENTPSGHPDRTNSVEPATYTTANFEQFGPRLNNIPQEIFTRLHSIDQSSSSSSSEEYSDGVPSRPHQIPLHHDTDVNYLRNGDFNLYDRHAVLLHRLLSRQKQLREDTLKFLTEGNEEDDYNNVNNNRNKDYDSEGDDMLSETQLDWEEYHEDDA